MAKQSFGFKLAVKTDSPQNQNKRGKNLHFKETKMKTMNKMALVAVVGVVISGCGFFDDLFGQESTNSNSILSINNYKAAVISAKGKLGDGKSMCSKFSKNELFGDSNSVGETFVNVGSFFDEKYTAAQMESKMDMQVHYVEIKESEKDSICYYIRTVNTAFLNTKLTAQDIEQFERFLAQRGEYKDKDDERILDTLKFFKYYNMTDKFYAQYDRAKKSSISSLEYLSGESSCGKFAYGTKQEDCDIKSDGINKLIEEDYYLRIDGNLDCYKFEIKSSGSDYDPRNDITEITKRCKTYYKPIYQWQQSIIEQSKKPKQSGAK